MLDGNGGSAMAQKPRPASKGPRKRRGGNHGNGERTQFKSGTNSHDGTVFRRGPDVLERGSVLGIQRALLNDEDGALADEVRKSKNRTLRILLAQAFLLAAEDPRLALLLAVDLRDGLEGKPVQTIRTQVSRQTIIYRAGDPPPGTPPPRPRQSLAPLPAATTLRHPAEIAQPDDGMVELGREESGG